MLLSSTLWCCFASLLAAVAASVPVPDLEKLFSRPPVILFLGAPFSGKGTQAEILQSALNLPLFQSGNLFRKEVASGSEMGKEMKTFMDAGQFIPDRLTRELIYRTLSGPEYRRGVIMDGYPRSHSHFCLFQDMLRALDMQIDAVIFLNASFEVLGERVQGRRICQNCQKTLSLHDTSPCCSAPLLQQRTDDSWETFLKRYRLFQEETAPLVEELRQLFPQKFIQIEQGSRQEMSEQILKGLAELPFKRVRPAIKDALNFDRPFNWLLNFVKAGRPIEQEDLAFYLNWALDCNRPDQSGVLRRIVFVATTSKLKFLEYRRTFLLYGIEVIRFPVLEDEQVIKTLLSAFDSANFSAIAMLSDTSNLYKPTSAPVSIEELEQGSLPLCSMQNGVKCVNYCVLNVRYCIKSKEDPSAVVLKTYKLVDSVAGEIKTEGLRLLPFSKVYGWDREFHVAGLGLSYQDLREAGFKNSARDRVLSAFLRRHIHYKSARNLNFNAIKVDQSVDFSVNLDAFFAGIEEYNLPLAQKYGFTRIWKRMLEAGVFLRAAAFRRIGIYWNPGVNGGLPLVKKADRIHELTYMAHDVGHQLLPDLVFTGVNSFVHKRVYIMWRMMSEAFTMALTDMVFIDALAKSGVDYDFGKRKIYPLFQALKLDVSPESNPQGYLAAIRSIVHANFVYCLRGDEFEYRALLSAAGNETGFITLEAFKLKYAPFFVEDFRWTEQNYNSMVSTRSLEAKKWWPAVQELNSLLGEFAIRSIDAFMADLDLKGIGKQSDELLEAVFLRAFDGLIVPVIAGPEPLDATSTPEQRKFRAFTRWMIGQLSICFKYDFIPESLVLFQTIKAELLALNGAITDAEIVRIRGLYDAYLAHLESVSLISADDRATFAQVYPLFDPFFVNYDKSVEEYEALAAISARILDDSSQLYATYHRQAGRVIGRPLSPEESAHFNEFYEQIESAGGRILNGIFVVELGVQILSREGDLLRVRVIGASMSTWSSMKWRLLSVKTPVPASLPLFEIKDYDVKAMKAIERALKVQLDEPVVEYSTLPAAQTGIVEFEVNVGELTADSVLGKRILSLLSEKVAN